MAPLRKPGESLAPILGAATGTARGARFPAANSAAYLRRRIEDLTAPKEAPKSRKAEKPKHEEAATAHPVPSIMPGKPGEPLTMSSLEIAELTGKDHKNVLADIRNMLNELGKTSAEFSANVPDSYGRRRPVINLPKRECMILVSGYSITLRARIIDRWQQLEAHVAAQAANPKAIPAFNEAEILRRIGGVVKAVAGRQIADLRGEMEAALETIGRLAQELREAKSAASPTFDLAGTVTSRDVMDMAGIRPETRVRGTGLIITRHLKTYCLERGLAAFRTPTEIDVYRRWRFPREAAADWVTREQGGEIIRNHIATSLKRKGAKGQGLCTLSRPRSTDETGRQT